MYTVTFGAQLMSITLKKNNIKYKINNIHMLIYNPYTFSFT